MNTGFQRGRKITPEIFSLVKAKRKKIEDLLDPTTFVLNKDEEEDSVSVLSIYTALQKDIFNILPIGKKYDMIIISQLE